MIKNGILQVDEIMGIPVVIDLIPHENVTSRQGYHMVPLSITAHNTGNDKKGADADMHTEYVDKTTSYVSWHFTIDDEKIIQELPITESAWHAGDGSEGTGNRTSIGTEICEHEGIDWEKAKENAAKLFDFLMDNVPTIEAIYPHQHWSGKYCPHKILDEGWDKFLDLVNSLKESPKSWQQKLGEVALDDLHSKGIITDVEAWKEKDLENEPTPLWLTFHLIKIIAGGN